MLKDFLASLDNGCHFKELGERDWTVVPQAKHGIS